MYKMANNEMILKIKKFNYNVHIVNLLQLTVQTKYIIALF